MSWFQKTITLPSKNRGCHLITPLLLKEVSEITKYRIGCAHFFIKHSSASITINENYDTDVRKDMEDILNRIVPEKASYRHTMEGPDDMPAHAKASLFGNSLTIPITDGSLNLGTWQGIWFCEHRDSGGPRSIVVTLNGELK
eukprot:TRINITY_DN17701_c0_g1_i1.p1 TRINITY_DN17701_c0_g1~~TRINITY_DN17701_c0_g1_i1.p1  ORF type:complete len:149 (-),score=25.67 TRINITY_DN17701_c0_g1_i1:47-472(-)